MRALGWRGGLRVDRGWGRGGGGDTSIAGDGGQCAFGVGGGGVMVAKPI